MQLSRYKTVEKCRMRLSVPSLGVSMYEREYKIATRLWVNCYKFGLLERFVSQFGIVADLIVARLQ